MPKKPKEKPEIDNEKSDAHEKASWSKDQKERGYYYDDAHGYEVYKPESPKDDKDG
ncbi:MAG: hypothetical protein ABIO36_03595 [Pyrinomonadaceae bacterium]